MNINLSRFCSANFACVLNSEADVDAEGSSALCSDVRISECGIGKPMAVKITSICQVCKSPGRKRTHPKANWLLGLPGLSK